MLSDTNTNTNTEKNNPLLIYSAWIAEAKVTSFQSHGDDDLTGETDLNSGKKGWSEHTLDLAKRSFIDTLACAIPGSQADVCQKLLTVRDAFGAGSATLIGQQIMGSVIFAALFNGTAAHALDFDDDFDPAKGHPSAVIIPALLALAEKHRSDGFHLLDAYIVGLQIMGLTGQGLNPFHRRRGWHATSTIGSLAAAAACARLLQLDTLQTAHAISIASSLAGGFMSQFGTDAKPMHAGFAAAAGVQAALFAQAGLTAGLNTLDASNGMNTLMVGQDLAELKVLMQDKDEYGQKMSFPLNPAQPLMIEAFGLKIKRFPNCGSVHRALDGLLKLKSQYDFTADEVEYIRVTAPSAHLKNLMYSRPETPQQAKFSLEYGLITGLLFDNVTLDDFSESAVLRPEIQQLLPLVQKQAVDKLESECPTQVEVRLKSGLRFKTEVFMAVGTRAFPLTDAQLWQKFDACTASAMKADDKDELKALLDSIAQLDNTDDLMRGLTRITF
ncbi:MmgE/PrpD family protein [Oceanospirillum sediminis]|uniref:MmgE/PrpD family protein n=1 Tax=Oceanospirillum sediminis TaxID=2760088 RepID=A0A839IPE4_9GAMM|nr:MmgE/PrpD family protein [Oceanospirillum sediminis]MBB1487373.1 MmgE/PrpD family protein [Oceanospirillum sediminis]